MAWTITIDRFRWIFWNIPMNNVCNVYPTSNLIDHLYFSITSWGTNRRFFVSLIDWSINNQISCIGQKENKTKSAQVAFAILHLLYLDLYSILKLKVQKLIKYMKKCAEHSWKATFQIHLNPNYFQSNLNDTELIGWLCWFWNDARNCCKCGMRRTDAIQSKIYGVFLCISSIWKRSLVRYMGYRSGGVDWITS